uniref:Putative secreted protein n=1 Tax=Ixodes ricinus TaxID=34613 RepID=A0A6B0UU67_IXORI
MRSTGRSVAGVPRPQWLCTAGCVAWPCGASWALPLAAVEADALQLGLQLLDPLVLGRQLVLEALQLCRLALVGLAQLGLCPGRLKVQLGLAGAAVIVLDGDEGGHGQRVARHHVTKEPPGVVLVVFATSAATTAPGKVATW